MKGSTVIFADVCTHHCTPLHHKVVMHCPTPRLAEIEDRTKISYLILQRHQADAIWPTCFPTHYYSQSYQGMNLYSTPDTESLAHNASIVLSLAFLHFCWGSVFKYVS